MLFPPAGAGISNHGALTGLANDDHSQYALLAGRAGGQTLYGGAAASDNLILESTSHTSKGDVHVRGGLLRVDAGKGIQVIAATGNNILNANGVWTYKADAGGGGAGPAHILDRDHVNAGDIISFRHQNAEKAKVTSGGLGDFNLGGIRTKHEAAATPTGGSSGEVRVGTDKVWWNDAGTWKSIAAGAGGGYNTVQEEGTGLTQRTVLNFIGAAITAADNVGLGKTEVTLSQSPAASTSVVGTGRTITAGAGLSGGGDMTADRTISLITPVAATSGGTGLSTYTLGDVLYSSAADTLAKLAGNITTTRKFLRQTGTGTVSAAPAWDTLVAGDLPSHTHAAGDITSGILPIARGGTNSGAALGGNAIMVSSGVGAIVEASTLTNGQLLIGSTGAAPVAAALTAGAGVSITNGAGTVTVAASNNGRDQSLDFIIDNAGSVITTGSKGYLRVEYACDILNWAIYGDVSGSIVVDIKRATHTNFPTTATMVGAGNKPTLSAAQKNQAAPSGWTSPAIAAGDILEFNVDSASTVTRVTLSLQVRKT